MKKEIPTEPLSDESEWSDSADPSEDEELSSHYGEDEEEDGDVHESGGESDSSEDEESSLDDGEDRGTNRDVTKSVEESDSSEDELYVDWFVWEDKAHPLSNGPEPRSQKGDLFVQSGRTRRDISQVHTAPYRTRYSRRGMRQGQESSRVVDPEGLVVHPSFDFFLSEHCIVRKEKL